MRASPIRSLALAAMIFPAVALMACSSDVCERPAEARRIVSDDQIRTFQEVGVDFHCGDDVPELDGTYSATGGYVVYHDDESIIGNSVCDSEITIASTDEPAVYDVIRVLTRCVGETQSVENYASGVDGCFTLYNRTEGVFEGCETGDIGIFTGCMGEDGIENPQWAGLAVRREGDTCDSLNAQGRIALEGQVDAIALQGEFAPRIDD
jgi:hypothetical protein